MSDNTGIHEQGEPSAVELERVRALLAGLGEEPAPPAVVARLERLLEAQLPAAGTLPQRRRRRWLRPVLAAALPVAAIVAGVLVLSQTHDAGKGGKSVAGGAEVASQQAASPTLAPAGTAADSSVPGTASSGASGAAPAFSIESAAPAPATSSAKIVSPPATPAELRQAALDAYRETRRLLLARRTP